MSSRLRPVNIGRRHAMGCCAAAVAGLFTGLMASPARASVWNRCESSRALPASLHELTQASFDGLDPAQLWDVHAHLLGTGDSGSGCRIHPSLVEGVNLVERGRRLAILNASCVARDAESIDRAYVARLLELMADFPEGARWMLFAFDDACDDAGTPNPAQSTFFVPDAYAATMARTHAQRVAWVASVHPYRDDALERLAQARAGGAVAIKWLPSAMNIDLRDARLHIFYDQLAATRIPLIVHVGEEKAVPGARKHELGNPLHLREPLSRGVRVIAAHCASLGEALDLDAKAPGKRAAFDLFARLMDERSHEGRLLGDISAVFQTNREPRVWHELLRRQDWHARLLQGSDYPLPGLSVLHRPRAWVKAGLIDDAMAKHLAALRHHNPLLADFALKRAVRSRGAALGAQVFQTRDRVLTSS